MGADGGLLRQQGGPPLAGRALDQGDDGATDDLSHRHGGAPGGPGMETHAQSIDHAKPGGDQQALDQLQHPDPRRGQFADHHRDAFEAAMMATAIRLAFAVIAIAAAEARAADVPEPDAYRLEDYRAPTPATLRGAKVIGTDEAEKIWRSHSASFVDVMPRPPRPRGLPAG